MIYTVPVNSDKRLKTFIDFPHELYKKDPYYVPELFIAQQDLLTPGKHPFHEHSQIHLLLCYNSMQVVGRIAVILNNNHNKFNNKTDGFFGFFDCINDSEVSNMLLSEATKWLQLKGANTIIGPVNFSTNETCGLLIDGFDGAPFAMMTYNKPYYIDLLNKYGLEKKVDLLSYQINPSDISDKSVKLNGILKNRLKHKGITIRKIDLKKFKEEANKLREVYNSAWDKNLGFVPMTENEFNYLAKDLKLILDPDFCLLAEKDGKVIGFALAIPDVNQVLIKIKKGRLFPTGLLKLLLNKKKINGVRVIALGVIEGFRKMGIESCFYGDFISTSVKKGIQKAEASWILENNELMNRAMVNINGTAYKKYRIFEKAI